MRLKRNKFGAVKVRADGILFDSKLEHKRYQELKLMEKSGAIYGLRVHTRWRLDAYNNDMESVQVGCYESDFDYRDKEREIVEDCKGVMTPLSKWKIKHFEIQHGIKVRIIRA